MDIMQEISKTEYNTKINVIAELMPYFPLHECLYFLIPPIFSFIYPDLKYLPPRPRLTSISFYYTRSPHLFLQ